MEEDRDDAAVTPTYDMEAEINEVILRLDLTLVRPDNEDARPHSNGVDDHKSNGELNISAVESGKTGKLPADSSGSSSSNKGQHGDDKKRSKPLDFIRKLRQTGHQTDNGGSSRKSPDPLKVDRLPQKFIAKYVGCKACRGLWGIQHTREPVDALVDDLRRLERGEDLPLVRLDVSVGGIGVAVHPLNRSRLPVHDLGLLPLEFVSYAVQDTRYSRIFAFILVRELSSRNRSTECHAYLCDSAVSARRLAQSLALAFRLYERRLAGKPFRFTVDLRAPEELAAERAQGKASWSSSSSGSSSTALAAECDA